jgi:hypothetical protein
VPGSSKTARISMVVSPRLSAVSTTPTTLGFYEDWLNWPATDVTFELTIGTDTIPASAVTVLPPVLPAGVTSSDLWQLLFNPNTPVDPFTFNNSFASRLVRSYPAYWVRQFHRNTYNTLSSLPPGYPTFDELFGTPNADGRITKPGPYYPFINQGAAPPWPAAITLVNSDLVKSGGAIAPASSPDTATDLAQAYLFSQQLAPAAGSVPPALEPVVPDFHQIVSTLGKYPVLLRAFKLVFDLEVTLPSGLAATVPVSATPTWAPGSTFTGSTTNFVPAVQTTSATFLPAPRTTDPLINGGLLRLSDDIFPGVPAYPVVEADLDGSAAKSINFAQAIYNAVMVLPSQDTPKTHALPALRSSGLTLIATGAASDFAGSQSSQAKLNSAIEASTPSTPVSLYAEDVTQGYRIDVYDELTNGWYQLCARVAAGTVYGGSAPTGYVVGSGAGAVVVPLPEGTAGTANPTPGETGAPFDEGWIELSVAQQPVPPSPPGDLFVHETMCRWTGWSLVADRPGQHWAESSNSPAPNTYNQPNTTTNVPLQAAHAAAPGTLPVLRYGRTYRFGARAVDLAGNSLVFSPNPPPASLEWASPALRYGRLEPVATPVVVPAAPRTPGEHLLHLVIRSETYATPDSDVTPCVRNVVPGSVSEEMAEAHGLFDSAGVPNANMATYNLIAGLAGMTYATPSVVSALGGTQDTPNPGAYNWPSQMYYYTPPLAVPYLPDLVCRGATFVDLPGQTANTVVQASFADGSSPWPAVLPLTLTFSAGTAAPSVVTTGSETTVSVSMPQGSTQVAQLSAYLNSGDLTSMGLWEWLGEQGLQSAAIEDLITSGQNWMFTPYREVTFTHAVRTPNPATFGTPQIATRLPNKTYALFSDPDLAVDFAGSNKIELIADWTTPVDDGVNPAGSVPVTGMAHLADIPLALPAGKPAPQSIAVSDLRCEFGDTKYRSVTFTAQTTSRFAEYFQETVLVVLTGTSAVTVNAGGFAPGTVVVAEPGAQSTPPATPYQAPPGMAYQSGVDYSEDDEAGTLTLIAGGAIADGATVAVRFVAPTITNATGQTTLAVNSTARPAAPDIEYIVPSWSFVTETDGMGVSYTSTRTGNALRVYLARTWWSSGDGEQLGVVIWPQSTTPPTTLTNLVTAYGRDPLRTTNPTKLSPALADFPLAATTAETITLAESSGLPTSGGPYTVDIAGHSVQFEPTSHQLWYADVEIDTSEYYAGVSDAYSYFPFVRLALVRFQPNSISGCEVSPVVVADIVQVAPNRMATLTVSDLTTVNISVAGFGASAGSPIGVPPNAMTVTVQTQIPGVADPDLQWADVAGSEVTLAASQGAAYAMVWSGTVTLSAAPSSEAPVRLRLTETEYALYDPPTPPGGNPTYTSRIVYLDTIVLMGNQTISPGP